MDRDPRLGYTLQGYISTSYFNRYLDTMKKLQSIVMNLPVEARPRTSTATWSYAGQTQTGIVDESSPRRKVSTRPR
jgi:hypothetical protein